MKRRFAFIIALIILSVSLFAMNVQSGVFVIYDPLDSNLFNKDNTNILENYGFGITNDFDFSNLAITSDIRLKSLEKNDFSLDSVTYFCYRYKFSKLWCDLGAGFELALEKPVENSDRYYLTSNGTDIRNIFKLKKNHLVALAGMIRFRASVGCNITDRFSIRCDTSLNPYAIVMLYPEGSINDFFGLNDLIVAAMYRL